MSHLNTSIERKQLVAWVSVRWLPWLDKNVWPAVNALSALVPHPTEQQAPQADLLLGQALPVQDSGKSHDQRASYTATTNPPDVWTGVEDTWCPAGLGWFITDSGGRTPIYACKYARPIYS